jgi:hypothetical protein
MIPLGEDRPTAPPRRPSGRAVCKTEGKSGAATPRDGLHERNPSPGTAATAQKTCSYATQSPHDGCPERSALVLTAGALALRPWARPMPHRLTTAVPNAPRSCSPQVRSR